MNWTALIQKTGKDVCHTINYFENLPVFAVIAFSIDLMTNKVKRD